MGFLKSAGKVRNLWVLFENLSGRAFLLPTMIRSRKIGFELLPEFARARDLKGCFPFVGCA